MQLMYQKQFKTRWLQQLVNISRINYLQSSEQLSTFLLPQMKPPMYQTKRMQTIREEFVGFHLCEEGTSGRGIKTVITNAVADLGLTMNDCRGQCYDGAGNMPSRLDGAFIKEDYNKAIYFHCMNHRLNLCIANTRSYQLVRDMMATVRKLTEFFNNSPKQQQHLVKNIK